MLYHHDRNQTIGRWENVRVEDGRLMAEAVFDTEDEQAQKVSGKVERGFLKACSAGLRPIRVTENEDGVVMSRSELMEASIVSVPADGEAVVLYDENDRELSLEDVRLGFDLKNIKKMEKREVVLTAAALTGLGLGSEAGVAEVELAVAKKNTRIAELEAQLKKAEKAEVEGFLGQAVKDRKISAQEQEFYRKLCEGGHFETVREMIGKRPEQAGASLSAMVTPGRTAVHEDWTYLQWMKEDPEGLKKLKAENPERFEELKKGVRR
jgi:hypothetical protein